MLVITSYQCSVERSHDCVGLGVLDGHLVACACWCHTIWRGLILGAALSLFGDG